MIILSVIMQDLIVSHLNSINRSAKRQSRLGLKTTSRTGGRFCFPSLLIILLIRKKLTFVTPDPALMELN